MLKGNKIGFGLTGSFCTLEKIFVNLLELKAHGAEIFCFVTPNVLKLDTRFNKSRELLSRLENISQKEIISDIISAEKFGPFCKLDCMIIAPITGNSIAKFANGITDNAVLMAAKATLRNNKPVVLGLSTNDALGMNGINIMKLLNTKKIFFIPFGQDDPVNKPNSMTADFSKLKQSVKLAIKKQEQIQPVIIQNFYIKK